MNTDKLLTKLLMAATLLALLFSAACASHNEIHSSEGQALIQQGNAYMTCLQDGDWECASELLSPSSKHLVDDAERMARGVVNLDSVIEAYGPQISEWSFDRAQFSTRGGTSIGLLKGQVEYADGDHGKMSLEFEKDDQTWKVSSTNLGKWTDGLPE